MSADVYGHLRLSGDVKTTTTDSFTGMNMLVELVPHHQTTNPTDPEAPQRHREPVIMDALMVGEGAVAQAPTVTKDATYLFAGSLRARRMGTMVLPYLRIYHLAPLPTHTPTAQAPVPVPGNQWSNPHQPTPIAAGANGSGGDPYPTYRTESAPRNQ